VNRPAATTDVTGLKTISVSASQPTDPQLRWLIRGLDQPGGKLPLFDVEGRQISERTVRSCIEKGWAEPWFDNPIKPDWIICKLTEVGRKVAMAAG